MVLNGPGAARGPAWDPRQYERFQNERGLPFRDLLAHVPPISVNVAADLGCGTGELSRLLFERWPGAVVFGVDRSAEMLAKGRRACPERLKLVEADLREWRPPEPLDLVLSNAALHWVPDHSALLESVAGWLAPGGVLAVQIPNNRGEPAYSVMEDVLRSPRWERRVGPEATRVTVESPAWYLARLQALGLDPQVWETIYLHRLPDAAAVVEWLEGSTLRPVLTGLSKEEMAQLLEEMREGMAAAYPRGSVGVVFPFRRLFFVALKPS